ncbi:MAG: hypothetical protein H6707_19685 [Deltaproteobacteria bacterium]|nr:hypothetical protein [Deltaproteobacteria bacterium]
MSTHPCVGFAAGLRAAHVLGLIMLLGCLSAQRANARMRRPVSHEIIAQMKARGLPLAEIALVLAAHYAKRTDQAMVYRYIKRALAGGVDRGRADLVLAQFFRESDRYDAAFATLVRVLVQHPGQPKALVDLWRTLHRCQRTRCTVQTDLGAIRERLATFGLHYPARLSADPQAAMRSRKLADSGYQALLSSRPRFAAQLFFASIEEDPSNPLAHRGLAIARGRQADYRRAIGAYLLYLSLAPDAADADQVDRILVEYWRKTSD